MCERRKREKHKKEGMTLAKKKGTREMEEMKKGTREMEEMKKEGRKRRARLMDTCLYVEPQI